MAGPLSLYGEAHRVKDATNALNAFVSMILKRQPNEADTTSGSHGSTLFQSNASLEAETLLIDLEHPQAEKNRHILSLFGVWE